jgi:hypothetical protein
MEGLATTNETYTNEQNGFTFKNYNNEKLNPQFKTNYKMRFQIFWDMALCCCVSVSGVLKKCSRLIFKGQKVQELGSQHSFEMSGTTHPLTEYYISEDLNPQQH